MSETREENARITGTTLGVEDHGIFTCYITVEGEWGGQGFGGYAFDGPPPERKPGAERIGCGYGIDFIKGVLRAVGVDKWEDLVGKYVRIRHTHSEVSAIGNITKNQWFTPKELKP